MGKVLVAAMTAAVLLSGAEATSRPSAQPAPTTPVIGPLLPPSDRAWTADDYEAALKAFGEMPPKQLPDIAGPDASPVFRRMIDPANLKPFLDTTVPIEQRFLRWGRVTVATTKILMTYLPLIMQDSSRSDDLLWLEGLILQEGGSAIRMLDELKSNPEMAKANPSDVQKGLAKVTDGIEQMLDGTIKTLHNVPRHPGDARAHLAQVLAEEYPLLASYIGAEVRKRTETALAQLAQDDADPGVRTALAAYAPKK